MQPPPIRTAPLRDDAARVLAFDVFVHNVERAGSPLVYPKPARPSSTTIMLTKLIIRNFKQFQEVEIELGDAVVLIGPNNAGKTSALQALALWELGLRRWNEKRGAKAEIPKARAGVAINRRDLVSVPIPTANLLWRNRSWNESARDEAGKKVTRRVRIDVVVEGVTAGKEWRCGLEFDHENAESITCRPLRLSEDEKPERMPPLDEARDVKVAYLPPMSGLAAAEDRLEPGSIAVRIGEGRTAEVLRNLCGRVHEQPDRWARLTTRMRSLFGVDLDPPEYIAERGEIRMTYSDRGVQLDLSAAGRGLQQTLLLLSYLETTPGSVLLLDEPDAHLEILRQSQMYDVLTEAARENGSQIIAASHSEVLLDRAADRDVVVSFVGKPHRIDDRSSKSQVAKALKEIGFDQYYQATLRGWVLYLEGSTDLAILQTFAAVLGHAAAPLLGNAFVRPIGANQRSIAQGHFYGLREAKPDLVGAVLLDRDAAGVEPASGPLRELRWRRREIENYLTLPEVLYRYASAATDARPDETLLRRVESQELEAAMREVVTEQTAPAALKDREHPFWRDAKLSDDYLPAIFDAFYRKRGLRNLMLKRDYHVLARGMTATEIDREIVEKLDAIVAVASEAKPETDDR